MITLKGITWDHPRGYDPLVAASKLYAEQFGVKVEWQKRSLSDFGDQSLTAMATENDLLIIEHPHTGVASETNCLVPLEDLLTYEQLQQLEQQSAGPSFLSYYYQQKQWALPVDAAMQCAASRPDLMGEHKIPATWEEVFELCEALKTQDLQVGIAFCATDCLCTFLSLTAQFGSSVRENNHLLVTREVGLQVLQLMRTMRDNFHPNSLNWNPIQLYDHMTAENDIVYSPLAFGYTNYSREGFRKNKLCYHNAPWTKNIILGGAGIAVSAGSSHAKEAAEYAVWLCSAVIQNGVYVKEQGQPGNIVSWKDDAANALTNDFFLNTIDTLTYAYVRPRYSGWPAFQQWLGEALHQYLKEDLNPETVLNQLQQAYAASYENHL